MLTLAKLRKPLRPLRAAHWLKVSFSDRKDPESTYLLYQFASFDHHKCILESFCKYFQDDEIGAYTVESECKISCVFKIKRSNNLK